MPRTNIIAVSLCSRPRGGLDRILEPYGSETGINSRGNWGPHVYSRNASHRNYMPPSWSTEAQPLCRIMTLDCMIYTHTRVETSMFPETGSAHPCFGWSLGVGMLPGMLGHESSLLGCVSLPALFYGS